MKIEFLGHSCFLLEGSKKVLFDPYLSGNPLAAKKTEEIQVDYILVSHGHGDHLGDTIAIAKKNDATVVCVNELGYYLEQQGVTTQRMHIGGKSEIDGLKIKLTPAWHGSGICVEGKDAFSYVGPPCGFLVWLDGFCFYFAGDTGLFGDMEKIIGRYQIDVAFLPIGDWYTMGPDDAVLATNWLQPDTVVPMHYNTFDVIQQNGALFKAEIENKMDTRCVLLEPGQSFML